MQVERALAYKRLKMNLKNKVWKYATAIVVALIILNPEMIELALFIDAIGLEMFLMLLEIQIMAILGALLNNKIKPALTNLKYFIENHVLGIPLKRIIEKPGCLVFAVPSQATLMHMLVFSAAVGVVFNVQL